MSNSNPSNPNKKISPKTLDNQALRQQLRKELRQKRQALSAQAQEKAAQQVAELLIQLVQEEQPQTIGVYLATAGELSLAPFIQALWQLKKQVFVPVIDPQQFGKLHFLPYTPNAPLFKNKWGIWEPKLELSESIPIEAMDLLCTPLVGFDSQGQRIGMGGGFYDRALEAWHQGLHPNLAPIGIAHTFQQISQVPTEIWDIPLPRIATPEKIWRFKTANV